MPLISRSSFKIKGQRATNVPDRCTC